MSLLEHTIPSAHHLAEARSLALHKQIAEGLGDHPEWVQRAQAQVSRWRREHTLSLEYVELWSALLDGPLDGVQAVLLDNTKAGKALRQTTPFAGAIDPRTRWRIWREVRVLWERSLKPEEVAADNETKWLGTSWNTSSSGPHQTCLFPSSCAFSINHAGGTSLQDSSASRSLTLGSRARRTSPVTRASLGTFFRPRIFER